MTRKPKGSSYTISLTKLFERILTVHSRYIRLLLACLDKNLKQTAIQKLNQKKEYFFFKLF